MPKTTQAELANPDGGPPIVIEFTRPTVLQMAEATNVYAMVAEVIGEDHPATVGNLNVFCGVVRYSNATRLPTADGDLVDIPKYPSNASVYAEAFNAFMGMDYGDFQLLVNAHETVLKPDVPAYAKPPEMQTPGEAENPN